MNVLSRSPDGKTLAVPDMKNDVVIYDTDRGGNMGYDNDFLYSC